MAGSGTSRLVQSSNAMKGGSQSLLVKALENANQEAIKASGTKKENKKK